MPSFEIGEDRTRLHFSWKFRGNDLCLHIGGGRDHVGAVALATRVSEGNVRTQILTIPGHRENELVAAAAETLCRTLGAAACVSAGVHLDRITPEEIEMILRNVETGTRRLIAELQNRS